jgi:hypothetical protein
MIWADRSQRASRKRGQRATRRLHRLRSRCCPACRHIGPPTWHWCILCGGETSSVTNVVPPVTIAEACVAYLEGASADAR